MFITIATCVENIAFLLYPLKIRGVSDPSNSGEFWCGRAESSFHTGNGPLELPFFLFLYDNKHRWGNLGINSFIFKYFSLYYQCDFSVENKFSEEELRRNRLIAPPAHGL